MTATSHAIENQDPDTALPQSRPLQLRRAMRAIGRLITDKEDTAQVFEIMQALSGNSLRDGYRRLLKTSEGGRQAYMHMELADKLQDPAWLAQFDPGTVGAAYRDFIAPRKLSAYGLADESRKVPEIAQDIDRPHPTAWYGRRARDVHDIWHVLTGYGTDALGEACVVAFSYPQTGNFGFGFIALAGALEFGRAFTGRPYMRAIAQAFAHGREARWLMAQDYEKLMAEPLDGARRRLNIAPPTVYNSIDPQYRDQLPKRTAAMRPDGTARPSQELSA